MRLPLKRPQLQACYHILLRSRQKRIARNPRNGFSVLLQAHVRNLAIASDIRVRMITGFPFMAAATFLYAPQTALPLCRHGVPVHKQKFGAEQSMPSPSYWALVHVPGLSNVAHDFHLHAVLCDEGLPIYSSSSFFSARTAFSSPRNQPSQPGRVHIRFAGAAVQHHLVPVPDADP